MMNQNNLNNYFQNMNMMNQYNNCIPNQNNMNMMINNNNMFQYFNNMMNNLNNMNNMDMNFYNNMGNPGFNNMQDWPGNQNNGFNNNSQIFLMQNIFDNLKFQEDPYKIQKAIALCIDNNNHKDKYVSGGNALFTTSTNDKNYDKNFNNNSKDTINIVFVSMKGNRHIRKYDQNDKIINVLENFLKEFGLPKNALKEIQFLYNAVNLNNLEENITLKEYGVKNSARINIIDMKNIIAAQK